MVDWFASFVDLFVHLDVHLSSVIGQFGIWTYLILFLIIFCETGLVVTPFLPGDSLLFAAGAFAGKGDLELTILIPILSLAGILGDAVNYSVGRFFGPKLLTDNVWFLKREYLEKTHRFYERYGGKTIIIARFVPIVRTFAPFLAGVGQMQYSRFALFNCLGGLVWVCGFCVLGYFFGNLPLVKRNFTLVILAIIIISVLPALIEVLRNRGKNTQHLV
ncbi:MAG: DedA family protein [Proteobacteria bacterium]|nr:DedA family protein [Pseudomonadota bacterium]NDC22996.1 DedA family protein [Pseudomonadota bacterium]NDD03348.1 DedA family protein [Pseudomonadota bacterium]NDG25569.1 DedA family protein [Pseudomonadota bacterium]